MYVLFALVAIPLLFFMLVWVVVTAYRIFNPEVPRPLEKESFMIRTQTTSTGRRVPVGARDIREDHRRHRRQLRPYRYAWGDSEGLPDHWHEDLWLRRN